jgi:hypothetical protein
MKLKIIGIRYAVRSDGQPVMQYRVYSAAIGKSFWIPQQIKGEVKNFNNKKQ